MMSVMPNGIWITADDTSCPDFILFSKGSNGNIIVCKGAQRLPGISPQMAHHSHSRPSFSARLGSSGE